MDLLKVLAIIFGSIYIILSIIRVGQIKKDSSVILLVGLIKTVKRKNQVRLIKFRDLMKKDGSFEKCPHCNLNRVTDPSKLKWISGSQLPLMIVDDPFCQECGHSFVFKKRFCGRRKFAIVPPRECEKN
jgi:hypothetical protein